MLELPRVGDASGEKERPAKALVMRCASILISGISIDNMYVALLILLEYIQIAGTFNML